VINGEALLYDLREVIFNNNTKQLFDLVYGSENMREIFAKWFRAFMVISFQIFLHRKCNVLSSKCSIWKIPMMLE
jgi:hypothetical protein